MAALTFWATPFLNRQPEHYVFPAARYGRLSLKAPDGFAFRGDPREGESG